MTNKLRPFILAVLILSLVAAGVPLSDSLAKWGRRPSVGRRGKHKRYRHSRAWWRRRRARLRQKRRLALRRRRAASRQNVAAGARPNVAKAAKPTPVAAAALRIPKVSAVAPAKPRPAVGLSLPAAWSEARADGRDELKFAVASPDGRLAGTAVLSAIRPPAPEAGDAPPVAPSRLKTIGGVPLTTLRRTVIDRMVAEGGWVVNDMVREIEGRRVYVVLAQTGAGGVAREARTFYFTEVEGRLYSLATNSPVELAAPVAADAEKLMATLRRSSGDGAMASQK